MRFTSSLCGGLEEANLQVCNAQYRTNPQTNLTRWARVGCGLAAATDQGEEP